MRAARHVYMFLEAVSAFASTVVFSIVALYRFRVAGLDDLQLVLAGTVMEDAILLFEIPTGVIADVVSRRASVIIGHLGMGLAFSRRADFTGVSPQAWRLGFVQHAATLSVDEKGTIATAATAVGVQALALPVPLIFNRPYLLIIRDMLTSEPLLMAWAANPANN